MSATKYTGYSSFEYLVEGNDYELISLPRQAGRVESTGPTLSVEQEQRATRLLEDSMVVSFHDHPTLWPGTWDEMLKYRRQGRDWIGYEGLSRSGMHAVFDGFTDGTGLITSQHGWKWEELIHDVGMRLSDLAHQDFVTVAHKTADIRRAKEAGQVALVLCTEALTPIENEIDRIDVLYGIGLRCMGLVYSDSNMLGSGLRESGDGGLTGLGRQAVKRMNRLGVLIDVSHSGDQTSLDAIRASDSPVCITHAGARSVWNTRRMKPDEVLRACASEGGVIGIEAAPHTTLTSQDRKHSIDGVMAHFEYCAELVGIEHVAFGPDTLFGDHVAVHEMFSGHLSIQETHAGNDFDHVPFVNGIENPAEAMSNICRWLVAKNYSDDEIAFALGGNIMRVMEDVIG